MVKSFLVSFLRICLLEKGINATALTGAQAGFRTNNDHTNAKIIEMKCDRLLSELENHDVVVVAGFQGASKKRGYYHNWAWRK